MNKFIQTIGSCFIACLALGLLTDSSLGSLSEDTDPDFGFEAAPSITSIFEDIVAHSNQGGKKKQRFLRFSLAKRSMPRPNPDFGASLDGLLVVSPELDMPIRGSSWTPIGTTMSYPETGGFNENGTTSGGIVPAPGALLLLGLAAAGRHRRRRQH